MWSSFKPCRHAPKSLESLLSFLWPLDMSQKLVILMISLSMLSFGCSIFTSFALQLSKVPFQNYNCPFEDLFCIFCEYYCDVLSSLLIAHYYVYVYLCSLQSSPPDEQVIELLRLMCVKNINDDYCMVLFSSIPNDKNADFDVRIWYSNYSCIIVHLC